MASIVFLDYETRSRANLPASGQWKYSLDPSTDVHCLAYAIDEGEPQLWTPGEPFPEDLRAAIASGAEIHAHNAAFEIAIWNNVSVPRHGWPEIPLSQWRCTAALASRNGLPRSLAKAAVAVGVSERKDSDGHRVMMQLCKPLKKTNEFDNDPEKLATLYAYCKQDVVVERAVDRACMPTGDREQQLWHLDQKINMRGIPVDVPLAKAAASIAREHSRIINSHIASLTEGKVTSATQGARLINWLDDQGVITGDVTARTVSKLLLDPSLPDPCGEVLRCRQEGARSSTAKFDAIVNRADADNRVRGAHVYHGAHTGRWAGSGVQFQNVPRGELSPKEIPVALKLLADGHYKGISILWRSVSGVLASCLRAAVRASEGCELLVCDFAGIEARVLAWMAGQDDLLDQFRANEDIYVSMASKIYDTPAEQVAKHQRQVGKVACLGLGYGMGAEKFAYTAQCFGIEMDEKFAELVKNIYRDTNYNVRGFWRNMQNCAMGACRTPGKELQANMVTWLRPKGRDVLLATLPSGRTLVYRKPQIVQEAPRWAENDGELVDVLQYHSPSFDTHIGTYGGKLVENVVQATARDFLADAMLRLDRAGMDIVMHVHDEVVIESPIGAHTIDEVSEIMCDSAPWGSSCPIAAEGFAAERYRK